MIGDPFLNYIALGLLIFVVVVIFYGIIAIHDIPAMLFVNTGRRDHELGAAFQQNSLQRRQIQWPVSARSGLERSGNTKPEGGNPIPRRL
jgi:hypothetical protein